MNTIKTIGCIAVVIAIACVAARISELGYKQEQPTVFTTSLTFSVTNRLAVTHYVIIPTTIPEWHEMTSRYPANVTRTVLNFK